MSDEIKEILDRLERIDHKEYSCGFEFADSASFQEICRCFEERKKLADYITNLEQENERLNNVISKFEKYIRNYINLLVDNPDMIEQGQLDILYEVLDMLKELKNNPNLPTN